MQCSQRTDVAEFSREVWRTSTLEVVQVGHTATAIKATIAIEEARRSTVPSYTVRCRLRHVDQRTGLVKLHQQLQQNVDSNFIITSADDVM